MFVLCDGGRGQYRGGEGAVQRWCGRPTSMSAIALISSSQLISASLLLPEALEMLIRTHITCVVRVLVDGQMVLHYTQHCAVRVLVDGPTVLHYTQHCSAKLL